MADKIGELFAIFMLCIIELFLEDSRGVLNGVERGVFKGADNGWIRGDDSRVFGILGGYGWNCSDNRWIVFFGL
jgi:hypothetical protein